MTRGRGPTTLRGRVAVAALLVLAVWVLVLTLGVNLVLREQLAAQADSGLRTRAQATAATIGTGNGSFTPTEAVDDSAIDVNTWIFQGEQLIEEPPGAAALRSTAAGLLGQGQIFLTTDGPSGSRWYAEPVVRGGAQVGTVVAVTSLAPYGNAEHLVLIATTVLAVLLLVGAYLALRASVGLALRPVEVMTHQAATWGSEDSGRRFGVSDRPAELAALARTLDQGLDRIASLLRHEQHVSAEISHELRTPLARLTADLDLLQREPALPAVLQDPVAQMSGTVDELTEIVGTLLDASPTRATPAGQCDVGEVLRDLLPRWRPPPRLEPFADRITVGVTAAILQRALTPVLDNAVRYASTAVTVGLRREPGEVRIDVLDDGPGIRGIDPAAIFQAGQQGTPADDHGGAGLGLSLAYRLVTGAGGSIRAATSTQGATISVSLPTA